MINGEFSVFIEDGSKNDGPLVAWVAEGIGPRVVTFGRYYAIGVHNRGELIAGIVLHGYDPHSRVLELSAYAIRPWLNRNVVNYTFGLAFDVFKARVVAARHSERNLQARKVWLRLGATETKIPNLYGEGVAECVTVYRREDWVGSRFYFHGQENQWGSTKADDSDTHDRDARHGGEGSVHARNTRGQPRRNHGRVYLH